MKAIETQLKVNSILFESNDPEILVKGNVQKGVMNYESEFLITHTQLNHLMNQLQKQNPEFIVSSLLISEKMFDGETLYSANFSGLNFCDVNLSYLPESANMKQIRA